MSDRELVTLAERLQGLCLGRGATVATAESCTGGMVAETITSVPGSSGYFVGGVVSYADEAKARLLGVPEDTLRAHGAVSAQVARAMAAGIQERLGSTFGISITGIAGPDGGTPAKPVGLGYIGLADVKGSDVRRFLWAGDREAIRTAATANALEWLIERIGSETA